MLDLGLCWNLALSVSQVLILPPRVGYLQAGVVVLIAVSSLPAVVVAVVLARIQVEVVAVLAGGNLAVAWVMRNPAAVGCNLDAVASYMAVAVHS